MTGWVEGPRIDAPIRGRGGVWGRVVPPVVAAAVLWLLGARTLAVVVLVVGTAVGVGALVSPGFGRGVDRVVGFIGHWAGRVLTVVLLGLFEVFVVAPVSLVAWVFRRDPLQTGAGLSGSWAGRDVAADAVLVERPYGFEARRVRGRVGRVVVLVPRVVGWVAIVLVADLLVGSLTRSTGAEVPATARLAAATAGEEWFDAYRAELESVTYTKDPFVLSVPVDRTGEFINVVDGHRTTVLPDSVGDDAPLVWVFGGSPAWGEGQRDAHTIPSELATLAADAGSPLRVVSWAQRGDTVFVEAQRLERALAHGAERPDLVVLLDGPDDLGVQAERVTGNPSQYGLGLGDQTVTSDERSVWERYRDTSVLYELGQQVRGLVAVVPAAAQTTDTTAGSSGTGVQSVRSGEIAAATASVYDRGRRLVSIVADAAGIPVVHVWVPVAASGDAHSTYRDAASRLTPGVVVLPALDGSDGPVFMDGVHTNEAGARQVAEDLYGELEPTLAGLGS